MVRVVIAFLAFSCAGCATVYKPELNGPTAEIRFIARSNAQTLVAALSDEQCGTSRNAGRLAILGGPISHTVSALKHQSLGMMGGEGLDLQDIHEMIVPAGRPFSYVFKTNNFAGSVCDAALTFTPQQGRQYETIFTLNPSGCKATVKTLIKEDGLVRREEHESRRIGCSYPGDF
jgi:hypothetical protein